MDPSRPRPNIAGPRRDKNPFRARAVARESAIAGQGGAGDMTPAEIIYLTVALAVILGAGAVIISALLEIAAEPYESSMHQADDQNNWQWRRKC